MGSTDTCRWVLLTRADGFYLHVQMGSTDTCRWVLLTRADGLYLHVQMGSTDTCRLVLLILADGFYWHVQMGSTDTCRWVSTDTCRWVLLTRADGFYWHVQMGSIDTCWWVLLTRADEFSFVHAYCGTAWHLDSNRRLSKGCVLVTYCTICCPVLSNFCWKHFSILTVNTVPTKLVLVFVAFSGFRNDTSSLT